jgi:hypothetical protein
MPANLQTRRSSLLGGVLASREDRATGQALATIQAGAFLERTSDEARCHLVVGRMADIGRATHHALDEGDAIVADLVSRAEGNPFAAKALSGIAEEGVRSLRNELRRLADGGSWS